MEFKKYSSLENTYRTKTIDKVIESGLSGGDWVVTEKVHGSNYSFLSGGVSIKACRRTGVIPEEGEDVTVTMRYKTFKLMGKVKYFN